MAPVMHEFMQVMTGDERRRALFGADKIDEKESNDTGEGRPRENLTDGNWNLPGRRSMDEAAHGLPHKFCLKGIDRWLSRVPLG
jgi:hypothetical protein